MSTRTVKRGRKTKGTIVDDTTVAEPVAPSEPTTAVEDNSQPASPASEPTTSTEVEAPSEPTTPETPVETPEAPVESQPTRLDKRIDQLQKKGQSMQELAENLGKLRETPSTNPLQEVSPQAPKLSDLVQGKEQLMPDELDKLGQDVWQQGAQSAKGMTALEVQQLRSEIVARDALRDAASDTDTLPVLYSELNPSSPNYNPALEKKIAADYQSLALSTNANGQTVVNPNVKLADVAKENVEFFHEAMEAGKAQTTTALESQAGEAALTPTAVSPEPDKKFEDLPLEEMEQRLRAQGRDI